MSLSTGFDSVGLTGARTVKVSKHVPLFFILKVELNVNVTLVLPCCAAKLEAVASSVQSICPPPELTELTGAGLDSKVIPAGRRSMSDAGNRMSRLPAPLMFRTRNVQVKVDPPTIVNALGVLASFTYG